MLGRSVAMTGGIFLALLGWAWLRAETHMSSPTLPERSVPAFCAVDVTSARTAIDLAAHSDESRDLIVSSLGDPDQTFLVRMALETATAPGLAAQYEISPLKWPARRKTSRTASTNETVSGGDASTDTPNTLARAAEERVFHLHVTDTPLEDARGYTRVAAKLAADGRHVRVYCDVQVKPTELAAGLIDEIVHRLDEQIIPRSREFLGTHSDVDGDGKLAVLLTPWLGRLQGGRTSVNGFVRSSDFHPQGIAPYSNRADILYLNSAIGSGPELTALLAHEYTHAVCCSLRQAGTQILNGAPDEADWLNEAIAHVSECLHDAGWSNLDHRVQRFLEQPQATPLVVRDYYRSGLWRDPACRGATFLFLQWCADGYGSDLLRELAVNPQSGVDNLEAVTGLPFATLYRHWTIALHQGSLPSVDLYRPLGACALAGPYRHTWDVTKGTLEFELRGTATAFVRCRTPATQRRHQRIVIEASPLARLQLTLAPAGGTTRPQTVPSPVNLSSVRSDSHTTVATQR